MEILIALIAVFVGSYVQSSIGFGLAIVAAPVLFFLNPAYVPVSITLLAFILSLANSVSHRGNVSFGLLKFSLIGRVPGTIAGGFLLLWINQDLLALWLGISVLTAVAVSLSSLKLEPTSGRMMVAGLLSGFMGTSTSIGGPPIALLLQHQQTNSIRANLSAFFTVSCLMSLLVFVFTGYMGWNHVLLVMPLLPAMLFGFWVAGKTNHLISREHIRAISLFICAVSGVIAISSYLF